MVIVFLREKFLFASVQKNAHSGLPLYQKTLRHRSFPVNVAEFSFYRINNKECLSVQKSKFIATNDSQI